MSSKLEVLFPIDEHAEPRSRSYEGEHVKKGGSKRSTLSHNKLFRIKSYKQKKLYQYIYNYAWMEFSDQKIMLIRSDSLGSIKK